MPQKSSNLVKLYGFGVLKNGVKYDFPFRESLYSMKPITEEIYFALGDSVDTTNAEFEKMNVCKTINTTWDASLKDGLVISTETNKAIQFLKSDVSDLSHAFFTDFIFNHIIWNNFNVGLDYLRSVFSNINSMPRVWAV